MTSVTVSIWHNVARDQAGRHTAPLDGFTPGDPMVRVFTYQATPRGRSPEAIAEDAFVLANGHPRDDETRLSRLYYQRRLRSLSFPGSHCVARGRVALTQVLCGLGLSLRRKSRRRPSAGMNSYGMALRARRRGDEPAQAGRHGTGPLYRRAGDRPRRAVPRCAGYRWPARQR
jgi:hypothetical protein